VGAFAADRDLASRRERGAEGTGTVRDHRRAVNHRVWPDMAGHGRTTKKGLDLANVLVRDSFQSVTGAVRWFTTCRNDVSGDPGNPPSCTLTLRGMTSNRLLITAMVVANRPVVKLPRPTASQPRGSMSCWPATAVRSTKIHLLADSRCRPITTVTTARQRHDSLALEFVMDKVCVLRPSAVGPAGRPTKCRPTRRPCPRRSVVTSAAVGSGRPFRSRRPLSTPTPTGNATSSNAL
jgi:hypothetical protein